MQGERRRVVGAAFEGPGVHVLHLARVRRGLCLRGPLLLRPCILCWSCYDHNTVKNFVTSHSCEYTY